MTDNLSKLAQSEIDQMSDASLDVLYRIAGERILDATNSTTLDQVKELGSFSPTLHTDPSTLALGEDISKFGKKLVQRINKAAYAYFCTEASEADRKEFFSKLNLGDASVIAALTSVLIAALAVSPAVAPVIAAAIFKIVIMPGMEVACESWGEVIKAQQE